MNQEVMRKREENTHVKEVKLGGPGPCKQPSRHCRNSSFHFISFQTCNQPTKQKPHRSCRNATLPLTAPRHHTAPHLHMTITCFCCTSDPKTSVVTRIAFRFYENPSRFMITICCIQAPQVQLLLPG